MTAKFNPGSFFSLFRYLAISLFTLRIGNMPLLRFTKIC